MEQLSGCRVLIIDNEPMGAQLLELILTRWRNDEVIIVPSGLGLDRNWPNMENANLFTNDYLAKAEEVNPDLIIVRIMMNPDGYEICRRLKQTPALASVPVLLQAAITPVNVYPTAREVGAAGYLYQPFGPDVFVEARDTVLQGGLYYPPLDSDDNHAVETTNE